MDPFQCADPLQPVERSSYPKYYIISTYTADQKYRRKSRPSCAKLNYNFRNSITVFVIFGHSLRFSTTAYINLDYSLQFSYGVYSSQPSHANLDTLLSSLACHSGVFIEGVIFAGSNINRSLC